MFDDIQSPFQNRILIGLIFHRIPIKIMHSINVVVIWNWFCKESYNILNPFSSLICTYYNFSQYLLSFFGYLGYTLACWVNFLHEGLQSKFFLSNQKNCQKVTFFEGSQVTKCNTLDLSDVVQRVT